MDYQILIGRTINIFDNEILVNSIKPVKGADYITRYCINNGPIYSKVDIGTCVSIVEAQIEEENRPKGLFSRFGLFYRSFTLDTETLSHTDRCIFFQQALGIRKYGYKVVGVFSHIRFGFKAFQIEFCWNEKKQYDKGVLPETLTDFKKIF